MVSIQPGFADPAFEAQAVFRSALSALSRPGTVQPLPAGLRPPKPLTPELAALALALADPDAPLWLDRALRQESAVAEYLRFHTGAPIVSDPGRAAFALVRRPHELANLSLFAQGSAEFPDRSTTVILAVDGLRVDDDPSRGGDDRFTVSGPGVKEVVHLSASPLPDDFVVLAQANAALFPRGVDWLLAGGGRIAGLPRSSHLSLHSCREAA